MTWLKREVPPTKIITDSMDVFFSGFTTKISEN
jgi:hypothetical protein